MLTTHDFTITNGTHTMNLSWSGANLDKAYINYSTADAEDAIDVATAEMDYWDIIEQRLARFPRYAGYKPVYNKGMNVVIWL